MKKYKWWIILSNLIVFTLYFNYSISTKEALLEKGDVILLKLAPVDPRSLIQGDYMRLRYEIGENINHDKLPKRGFIIVRTDSNNVARRIRFQSDNRPLSHGEHLIKYSAPDAFSINIGSGSFFFQEGQAKKYEVAAYGGLKVDTSGNSILIGLFDNEFQQIR